MKIINWKRAWINAKEAELDIKDENENEYAYLRSENERKLITVRVRHSL